MFGEEYEAAKAKAEKHLQGVSDLTMLVLKGHLLMEEALFSSVRKHVPNPEAFDKLNLRFIQMVHLARALFPAATDPERVQLENMYWDCLEALNAIRNRFAHRLEPTELTDLLDRLQVDSSKSENPLNDASVISSLSITLTFLVGWTFAVGERTSWLDDMTIAAQKLAPQSGSPSNE